MTDFNTKTWALDRLIADLNDSATYLEKRSAEARASANDWDNGLSVGYEIAAEYIRRAIDSSLIDYIRVDLLERAE